MSKAFWISVSVFLVVANFALLYQNLTVKQRSMAVEKAAQKSTLDTTQTDELARSFEALGRCAPQGEVVSDSPSDAVSTAAEETRSLGVRLYFSLVQDCMACIEAEVDKWNELARASRSAGGPVVVRGFTNIDGPMARRTLDRDLQPDFPVLHVADLRGALAEAGIPGTLAVLLVDEATGRNLVAHLPGAYPTEDRTFMERIKRLLQDCS